VHNEEAEKELAASIKAHGILQPIVIRRGGEGFEIVAGERRWRAAKRLKLSEIPCIRRPVEDDDMLTLALVENVQRRDLDPVEKARAFKEMMGSLSITQEEVARRIGLSRAGVANFLRLLALPKDIQDGVSRGTISFGHAKAIMALKDKAEQEDLFRRILTGGLSVREAEKEAKSRKRKKGKRGKKKYAAQVAELEESLMNKLGTRVKIQPGRKGGKILIDYYSDEDFERIFELLG
jgi:ParB family chromosome partitioning protein